MSVMTDLKSYAMRRHRLEIEDQFALRVLNDHSCQQVLDVGCGVGRFLQQLSISSAYGLDWNIENLRLISPDQARIRGNALTLPFSDSSFEGVHCSHLIEHFAPSDAYRLMHELGRVTKINGILIVRTPVLWNGFYNDLTHVRPYNPEVLVRYMCQEGGQKTRRSFDFHFKFVGLKWRYLPIIYVGKPQGWRFLLKAVSDWICRFHIHSWRRDAYILVLKRVG